MSQPQVRSCLKDLQAALKAAGLYPPGHPGIQSPIRNFFLGLTELLEAGHSIVLGVIDDVLVFDEIPFYETEGAWRPLFQALRERGIESITLHSGIEIDEVVAIIRILRGGEPGDPTDLAAVWKSHDIRNASFRELTDDDDPRGQARRAYEDSLGIVVNLMTELRMGRVPSAKGAVEVVHGMRDVILQDSSALLGMAMLKAYDEYTYNHSVNVAIFCLSLAQQLQLSPDEAHAFGLAGLLHDIGKARTPEEIIRKPGALDEAELRLIQLHPELGAEILESMHGIRPDARAMVLQHHLRFDRSGYPKQAAGTTVHPLAEAVGLADCYDALTTTRPYQRSRHPGDAALILRRQSGSAYRPELVEQFITMLGAYPTGETVRLATGELAVVVANNALDSTSPVVRLVTDASGQTLEQTIRVELADPSEAHRSIAVAVDPLSKGIDVPTVLEEELAG